MAMGFTHLSIVHPISVIGHPSAQGFWPFPKLGSWSFLKHFWFPIKVDQQKLGTKLPNASRTFPDTLPIDHRKHMETLISSRCGWSMSCLLRVTHPLKWLASQQIITSLPVGKGKNVQGYAALGGQVRFGPGNASQENVFPLWFIGKVVVPLGWYP